MDEQSAIRLCLKYRDPAGFEYLVARYRREAFYHAQAFLRNESDAADACQDAFARAFAAMPRLPALDEFYPWFYRILRNVCLNIQARRRTRQKYVDERMRSDSGGLGSETGVESATPASIAAAAEDAQEVWRVLGRLSTEHREILTLKYIHGFRYDRISQTLGIPRGTVMSRFYAARKAFRECFEQSADGEVRTG